MTSYEVESARQPAELLRKAWGWIALRGVFALVFGVLAVAMPGITLAILVMFWGAFALIDGVVALVAGLRIRESGQPLWALIVLGLLGIAAGVIALGWPGLTALTLVFIIGCWAIAIGVLQLVAAFRFRKYIEGEWLHALSGVLSLLFGIVLMARPAVGVVALVWIIGGFAILFGVVLIGMALRLRSLRQR